MPERLPSESPAGLAGRRLLVLSPVTPRQTSGGEIILYRHLARLAEAVDITVAVAAGQSSQLGRTLDVAAPPGLWALAQHGLERLTRTRFAPWARAARWMLPARVVVPCNLKRLREHIKYHRPDVILTVAHGDQAWLALEMAADCGVPLVSVFHDWFPAYLTVPAWARARLEANFRRLYQQSRVAFVVSESLKQALGPHHDAVVLYPIPGDSSVVPLATPSAPVRQKPLVLGYLGNLSGNYGGMMRQLWETVKGQSDLAVRMWGPLPDWPATLLQACCEDGSYGGYVPLETLHTTDVLLVVASFASEDATLMQTNFPSKLVEYCRFGKPVMIWGPEYSSGVQWARQHRAAHVVTEDAPEAVITAVRRLAQQPDEWQRLARAAQQAARTLFEPDRLQAQFVSGLMRAIRH